jgi:hypothetical protein
MAFHDTILPPKSQFVLQKYIENRKPTAEAVGGGYM